MTRKAIFELGPTNSGKTYHAVQHLVSAYHHRPGGTYVYAGPLRMLAGELLDKIGDHIGHENVGLLTGEYSFNAQAAVLCCTAEMAPDSGSVLIIDEAHWADDIQRGPAWTRLLRESTYDETIVLGPTECVDVLSSGYDDVVVNMHERKTPLKYAGSVKLSKIPKRSAVVTFSRKSVLLMTEKLRQHGYKVVCLYGNMPIDVRTQQIELFISGKADIVVTTDVIGHGINLPLDNVIFAQTSKYDGSELRPLRSWEAAQICGRAGRYGLSECGYAYVLADSQADGSVVKQGVLVATGQRASTLGDMRMTIAPTFADLHARKSSELLDALDAWLINARNEYRKDPYIKVSDMAHTISNINAIRKYVDINKMNVKDLWSLANAPLEPKAPALAAGAKWLTTSNIMALSQSYYDSVDANMLSIDSLETACYNINGFRSLGVVLTEYGGLPNGITAQDMLLLEHSYATKLIELMLKRQRF